VKVGSYKPNAWGIYDMHGNVWEWVNDYYDPKYYTKEKQTDPTGPKEGTERVVRGGSWRDNGIGGRAAIRGKFEPTVKYDNTGFRVLCEVAGKD